MTTLHRIVTGLIIALGILHLGFTPFNYGRFDMNAMWFLGSGLAIILAGFLNIAVIRGRGRDRLVWSLGVIANLTFAILFGVGLVLLTQPQVFVGVALFGSATICTVLGRHPPTA